MKRWAELLKDVCDRRKMEKSKPEAARFSARYLKEKQEERDAGVNRGTKKKEENVATREEKYDKVLKSSDQKLFDGLAYMNIVPAPAPAVDEVTSTPV